MNNKELKDMTLEELKACAYDHMYAIDQNQRALNIINGEISKKQTTPTSEGQSPK
jgi:hypothetical protein